MDAKFNFILTIAPTNKGKSIFLKNQESTPNILYINYNLQMSRAYIFGKYSI